MDHTEHREQERESSAAGGGSVLPFSGVGTGHTVSCTPALVGFVSDGTGCRGSG